MGPERALWPRPALLCSVFLGTDPGIVLRMGCSRDSEAAWENSAQGPRGPESGRWDQNGAKGARIRLKGPE